MAIYTHYEVANSPADPWKSAMGNTYTATPTLLKFFNTDGTLTKVHGAFIILNGNLLDGIISSLERTSANGAIVYETITGLNNPVNPFLASPLFSRITDLLDSSSDTLYGYSGKDYLDGGHKADKMYGGAGNDELHGSGDDLLVGGLHDDTYYAYAGDTIIEHEFGGYDSLYALGNLTLPDNVEGLSVGIWYSTTHGNGLDNHIHVYGQYNTVYGEAGQDWFYDSGFSSQLYGGPDDDLYIFLNGFHGGVHELANEGRDAVKTDFASYTLEANVEILYFDAAIVHLGYGNGGDNLFYGNKAKDTFYGYDGADWFIGDGSGDLFYGGTGDDQYQVRAGDTVVELDNEGIDTVATDISTYQLPDYVENLWTSGKVGLGNGLDNILAPNTGLAVELHGLGGNDTLRRGGSAGSLLDGGADDDTAVFGGDLANWLVFDRGDQVLLVGPSAKAIDRAIAVEHLRFDDGTIDVNDGSALFDTIYYMKQNADVLHSGGSALAHFNAFGWHEGRDPNAFFDTSAYLGAYKDVAISGMNPLDHYDQIGWKLGYDPSASFDTRLYLVHNPDVAASGVDPLAHYLQFGMAEGRASYAALGQTIVGGFDAEYYLMHNPDVAAAGADPLAHFQQFGWHEGRAPNGWFDTAGYLARYADVAAAGVNPLDHYEQIGWKEGRDPSLNFDTLKYLAANPDVAAGGGNPLDHFLQFGIYEGRSALGDGIWH